MDAKLEILRHLFQFARSECSWSFRYGFDWDDTVFLRTAVVRTEHGDVTAWTDFLKRLSKSDCFARWTYEQLRVIGFFPSKTGDDENSTEVPDARRWQLPDQERISLHDILERASEWPQPQTELPQRTRTSRTRIMYVEEKPGLAGHARIGLVTFSKSRSSVYYQGRRLQTLDGTGYKRNYRNVEPGLCYWVSGCRKDGRDTLYPGKVHIDEDVRVDYWYRIRNAPDLVDQAEFWSPGKYSKRTPR